MACQLINRESEEPVPQENTRTGWIDGEYDVTGNLNGITPDDWNRAREDAIDKAREELTAAYACTGDCEAKGEFCLLTVNVVQNRSGRIVRRMIPNPPDSFQYQRLGQRESEHRYVTYEIKAEAQCKCVGPSPLPARQPATAPLTLSLPWIPVFPLGLGMMLGAKPIVSKGPAQEKTSPVRELETAQKGEECDEQ